MKKLCLVATVEFPIRAFMIPHLREFQKHCKLSVVVNTADLSFLGTYGIDAEVIPLPIIRKISLHHDVVALSKLIILFRRRRFDVVHSITPKGGLLAMVASALAGVPCRIHMFTGQVWATSAGFSRQLLKSLDRLTAACASSVLTDSKSQIDFLVREKVVTEGKAALLGHGSISGVDSSRFRPDDNVRRQVRGELEIPQGAVLCIYLGRFARDKGVLDLAQSLAALAARCPSAHFAFVGPDEQGLRKRIDGLLGDARSRTRFIGYTLTPERYMAAGDILCLPSYREGFGVVVLEAAAAGVPSVASRVYGITDAVEDGFTGLLHEPGDIADITSKLGSLIDNHELRIALGRHAKARAESLFLEPIVVAAMLKHYRKLGIF